MSQPPAPSSGSGAAAESSAAGARAGPVSTNVEPAADPTADSSTQASEPEALQELRRQYPGKVPVHVVEHKAYVWRVEDASILRSEWHICGMLSGTLPLIPQQNAFLGLPMQLFPEEVVFLLRSKAIILIHDASSFDAPTDVELQAYHDAYDAEVRAYAARLAQDRVSGKTAKIEKLLAKAARSSMQSSMAGSSLDGDQGASAPGGEGGAAVQNSDNPLQKALEKRRLREEKRRLARMQMHDAAGAIAEDDEGVEGDQSVSEIPDISSLSVDESFALDSAPPPPAAEPASEEKAAPTPIKVPGAFPHITSGAALQPHYPTPWYHPERFPAPSPRVHATLSSAIRAGHWHYPSTRKERAHCAVFEDLHNKGYYMAKGVRFGGDFNVYPGDPLRYHSHFTATVRETPSSPLSAMELVANGRLATAVKKAHLISTASGVREGGALLEGEEEEDAAKENDIAHPYGSVEHLSLTWSGFGT